MFFLESIERNEQNRKRLQSERSIVLCFVYVGFFYEDLFFADSIFCALEANVD